jgi:hypothetical protein
MGKKHEWEGKYLNNSSRREISKWIKEKKEKSLIYVNLTITDLNRSAWRMHFGYCFAYDNCFWQLTVVYVCVIMEKLDNDFVSSVDTFFRKVYFDIHRNSENLYRSTCFSGFGSFYQFDDLIACCLVDSLCSLGNIRCYCCVITGSYRFPVVGSYRSSSVGYHTLSIMGSDRVVNGRIQTASYGIQPDLINFDRFW